MYICSVFYLFILVSLILVDKGVITRVNIIFVIPVMYSLFNFQVKIFQQFDAAAYSTYLRIIYNICFNIKVFMYTIS